MKIKDLPQEIKELALKRQVEQGNEADENFYLHEAFTWGKTNEGFVFWEDIETGYFKTFYDLYPQNVDTPIENVDTSEQNMEICRDKHVQSVIDKFKQRSEIGYFKYGTTLERQDLNVHDWLIHLQEELMDAVLYVERLKSEKI
jgi:hypothetical protein